MTKTRRLLIIGPSFRRNKDNRLLPALERYDGLFFRVARKHLGSAKDVDVAVMIDDLTIVDSTTPLPYSEAEGKRWDDKAIPTNAIGNARVKNEIYLRNKLKRKKYSEVFISMGKKYAIALPDLAESAVTVVFPSTGGPGPKAQALRHWFKKE